MDRQRALEELIKYTTPPTLCPDEFTEKEYREAIEAKTGMRRGRNWARNRLKEKVEEGILQERTVLHGGRNCKAYSFTDGGIEKLAQLFE